MSAITPKAVVAAAIAMAASLIAAINT